MGSFDDQRRSTWDKLSEAIAAHDEQAALELAEFALEGECRVIFELLIGWADELRRLLGERGVPERELMPIPSASPASSPFRTANPTPAPAGRR